MSKYSNKRPDKDLERICWIVTADFEVKKVTAIYRAESTHWHYLIPTETGSYGYSNLRPYYPTLGNGNASYWGDGPHYKTRAAAKADQRKIIAKEVKLLKVLAKANLLKAIKNLKSKI